MIRPDRIFPCLVWLRDYNRSWLAGDLLAAVIVTVMLIPQSLAYAILAGLPPETGLYASILPLVAYTLFGTSRTLSVGPVAVTSLMTGAALARLGLSGEAAVQGAVLLAVMSGAFLLLMGMARAGFLVNFISHPVVSGFITASAILIAFSQLGNVLGIRSEGDTIPRVAASLLENLPQINPSTVAIGAGALLFLFWARAMLPALLRKAGMSAAASALLVKSAPALMVVLSTVLATLLELDARGLALVGAVPAGLPAPSLPSEDPAVWRELAMTAVLISIIGYVESISVGKTLGARRRQKIDPDQELVALGASNLAAGFSGGFPVTAGFSRSVVNFDAGAATPAAGLFTAIGIATAILLFTEQLALLPRAALAATIIVAVLGLVDFSILRKTWRYSRSDFIAVTATLVLTLAAGVEIGVLCGVLASLALHLYKTSRPHIAEVGEIEGTGHFRNVRRHKVKTNQAILSLRVDERLYFANTSFLEERIFTSLAERQGLRHVILMCTAVNEIDFSGLDVLENINQRLRELDIGFHLSEVKGPVMDALQKSDFLEHLNGEVFLSQHMAVESLRHRMEEEFEGPPEPAENV